MNIFSDTYDQLNSKSPTLAPAMFSINKLFNYTFIFYDKKTKTKQNLKLKIEYINKQYIRHCISSGYLNWSLYTVLIEI